MQIKLDENLGERGRQMLADAGHDVATVAEQGLTSAIDVDLIEICGEETRCLVTRDLDFSNPFVFPPEDYTGIAVLRLPRRPALREMRAKPLQFRPLSEFLDEYNPRVGDASRTSRRLSAEIFPRLVATDQRPTDEQAATRDTRRRIGG